MAKPREEKIRQQAYQIVLSTDAGQIVIQDLITFMQSCDDPVRALGRADVITRFFREEYRAMQKEIQPEETE